MKLLFSKDWLRKRINSDPDMDIEAGGIAPSRFFMDHGMIHDRKTGRHISTDESTHPGGTAELFTILQELSP